MNPAQKLITEILACYTEVCNLKGMIEDLHEIASEECSLHVPPKDPNDEDDFDSIHGCLHPTGTICCIDECPLWREGDEKD